MAVCRLAAAVLLAALTVACAPVPSPDEDVPVVAEDRPSLPPQRKAKVANGPSATSQLLTQYYARVERSLLAKGLLRTDGGGRDTPFDAATLADTFIRVALFDEYSEVGGQLVAKQTASRLHRWTVPVNVTLDFGPSVAPEVVARDTALVRAYVARLARATGHQMQLSDGPGNFNVFIVNEDERRALAPRLRDLIPGLSDAALRLVTDLPQSNYCIAYALDGTDSGSYSRAIAIVRAEHPDLLRLSCLHEEIAQGLGLSNDSPLARPSIFNDDEEFALLTPMDEMMLKMLYDSRLRPGMTAAEAAPIAQGIALELLGGDV
ncbi:lipoprotein, putative [Oceaniovalibus guishaninsula JLT2003]|uniref:Lipoprotein, putative n=1 Tax=Oceaniovalibus guishaninsula JLT2003 TaxID=1231392 RepID=K2HDC9_9RHOB|nr:DUF2927 domain-containing protein [Oceaniovalibus guishaninsula]EKE45463.1 lipoprotein, putative [Oceaniovalibus guishaninsula JLT2003]